MARAGLRKGHEDSSESPSATREVLPERMNQARRWAYHDGFHEESHGIGPMPTICRTAAASVKATRRIPAFPHVSERGSVSPLKSFLCQTNLHQKPNCSVPPTRLSTRATLMPPWPS